MILGNFTHNKNKPLGEQKIKVKHFLEVLKINFRSEDEALS